MPKIAYLISRYPAISHTFILREIVGLRARGFKIKTASVNPPDRPAAEMPKDEAEEYAGTYYLKQHGIRGALIAHLSGLRHPRAYWKGFSAALCFGRSDFKQITYGLFYFTEALMLHRWMRAHGIQHLHVHFASAAANIGLLLRQFSNIHWTLTVHGPDEFYDAKGQHLAEKMAWADGVICISHFAKSQLMQLSAPEHWHKYEVARLGVESQVYAASTSRRDLNAPFTLLCVGRLTPAKGQRLLLNLAQRLKQEARPFKLVLVGTGPDEAGLKATTQQHQLENHVLFTGAQTPDQVRDWYQQADAFVLPSFSEGIPVVLMEAMAAGLPCITTRITGIPELIENGVDGLLVAPADEDGLYSATHILMDDRELGQQLGQMAQTKVKTQYNLTTNLDRLAKLFRNGPIHHPSSHRQETQNIGAVENLQQNA
jgi:colanic acid/amylovoran biosynthesis glycosyltransferase